MLKLGLTALLIGILPVACGGDGGSNANPDMSDMAAAVTSWTVSGTITLPASETATPLKLVATINALSNSTANFASEVVTLNYSGSPPTVPFTLNIDTTRLGTLTSEQILDLIVWKDSNANGVPDPAEPLRTLNSKDASDGIFGDGTSYPPASGFQFVHIGSSGSGQKGTFSLKGPAWFVYKGCSDFSCLQLISTSNMQFTSGQLSYSSFNSTAIN